MQIPRRSCRPNSEFLGTRSPGFTLIELLIVIAIIAVLISIILPSLRSARDAGRSVVCRSNARQIAVAMALYAGDYKVIPGTYWQGPINLDWAGRENAEYLKAPEKFRHPLETSVLREYFARTDAILTCPTGKRPNLLFDYTMVIRMAGARADTSWPVSYPTQPAVATSPRAYFTGMPLIVEEDERFYNLAYDDGSFAGSDQWSRRHNGVGSVAFLDSSAIGFKSPTGGNEKKEEAGDLKVSQLSLHAKGKTFVLSSSNDKEFGWVNSPR